MKNELTIQDIIKKSGANESASLAIKPLEVLSSEFLDRSPSASSNPSGGKMTLQEILEKVKANPQAQKAVTYLLDGKKGLKSRMRAAYAQLQTGKVRVDASRKARYMVAPEIRNWDVDPRAIWAATFILLGHVGEAKTALHNDIRSMEAK